MSVALRTPLEPVGAAIRELIAENDQLLAEIERLNQQNIRLQRELSNVLTRLKNHPSSPQPDRRVIAYDAARRRAAAAPFGEPVVLCQGVTFDVDGWRLASNDGRVEKLSCIEGLLLRALVDQRGVTVQRAALIRQVWQQEFSTKRTRSVLSSTTGRLRAKLRQVGAPPELITSIPNVGLRLETT